jgi:uncharacterized protein YeaO (DUF488 family)
VPEAKYDTGMPIVDTGTHSVDQLTIAQFWWRLVGQAAGGHDKGMLTRYKIYRGKRPVDEPLPNGIRQDTRKHTKHCLRPSAEIVIQFLAAPNSTAWNKFSAQYVRDLEQRYEQDSTHFDHLANLAIEYDVYIGCSCPTAKNPDVNHCHTMLALKFMKEHYPAIEIEFP